MPSSAKDNQNSDSYITANDLAQYVVCPKAWDLKRQTEIKGHNIKVNIDAAKSRSEWLSTYSAIAQTKLHTKVMFVLLIFVVVSIVLKEFIGSSPAINHQEIRNFFYENSIPPELLLLLVLIGLLILFWDFFDRRYQKLTKDSNISSKTKILALKDDREIPATMFTSKNLGLRAKPDALLKEKSLKIPVDIVPLSSKVKDRHVIKIIAYLALIEEDQKKSSPYGSLIMGKKRREVRVKYTKEKKNWLESLIKEINSIKNGVPAQAKPGKIKCRNCDFKEKCESVWQD